MSGEGAFFGFRAVPVIDGAGEPDSRALPIVAGRRDGGEWRVWICSGSHGTELDPARARQLAADILNVCDVIEGVHEVTAKPRVEHGATVLRQAQDERGSCE